MTDWPRHPAHIDSYVRILGPQQAMDFILTFGGAEIYLAANPKTRSMLVEKIGPDQAAALAEELGAGGKVRVPTAKPWLAACLSQQGLKTAEIARRLHMSDTVVRGWLKRAPRGGGKTDPRQMNLF